MIMLVLLLQVSARSLLLARQLELKPGFRAIWLQRFPFLYHVVLVLKHDLKPMNMFRAAFPVCNVLENEPDRPGIFFKSPRAKSWLVAISRVQSHEQRATIGMIDGDEAGIAFQQRAAV